MREIRLSGSVEGVVSNHDPYSDFNYHRIHGALGVVLLCKQILSACGCLHYATSKKCLMAIPLLCPHYESLRIVSCALALAFWLFLKG